ncbi:NAD-dependent epimerase/dehydratase family protein [Quisquiliibacterium transsilvanicum]|uniref:NAD-dependent epimerase/dehydratase family protein n=1 Tax=Quisquiliibacterium transsilvanicum TaxID=1549638 RepID=UPI00161A0358|nr:NAD(P)-dependent oxidoreductase [Quisquiliibacterium transsilvanicum]
MSLPNPLPILVTGSHGLIGTALSSALRAAGHAVSGLDLRAPDESRGDLLDPSAVGQALEGCCGVVHLAAVSRVVDGERDPQTCREVNVGGTRVLLEAALSRPEAPWVIYASSREVYGQPARLPAGEASPRAPVNAYGRSKVEAEDLVSGSGLRSAILRFSNVYGSTDDHADRVVPAFARNAVLGRPLRVDGRDCTFDFTHVADTVRGILAVVRSLESGESLAPLHLLTGVPTTLGELAALAVELAGSRSPIVEAPSRSFDVHSFHGDPGRAAELLGWRAEVGLREGLARLIRDFRALSAPA